MTLTLNTMYKCRRGYLIPRSHFKDEKGARFIVVQITDEEEGHIITGYVTMDAKEIRKELGLKKNERIEVK